MLARLADDHHVSPSPDTTYHFFAQAPADLKTRPVVAGTRPCDFLAALILAQVGFKSLVLERGKEVRQRTKDTWKIMA